MGVGRRRVSQLTGSLRELVLITEPRVEGERRLVLTDRALAALARRDRASPADARRRWERGPESGRTNAAVAGRARPPHAPAAAPHRPHSGRAPLRDGAGRAIPSARLGSAPARPAAARLALLAFGGRPALDPPGRVLLLRAQASAGPYSLSGSGARSGRGTMRSRLAPYLRYFATRRPTDDHGVRPELWVVFDDPLAADRFLAVARAELKRTRVELPLLVSDRERIADLGPLGAAWRGTQSWEYRKPLALR